MEELINQIVQKTGIPADLRRSAVEMVLAFLKNKLPAALGGQLDQAIAGGVEGGAGGLGDIAKNLSGLLGK